MKLYLIRHAESDYNKNFSHLIGGRSNHSPLSLEGIAQAHQLGQRLAKEHYHFDKIYSSPAVRAVETAKISLSHTNHPIDKIVYSEKLYELDQGDWVGLERTKAYNTENTKLINADPWNFAAPNGESQKQTEYRYLDFINEEIIPQNSDTAAIYGHGMAFKCLLRGLINSDPKNTYRIQVDNTSISEFEYEKGLWRLVRWNDAGHLK